MKALGLVSGVTIAAATLASTVAAQSQSFKSIPPLVIKVKTGASPSLQRQVDDS